MKVILLEDIKNVGKKGQLLDAADGYARNYLLPKKLAVLANNENLNILEQKKKSDENKSKRELEAAETLGNKLKETKLKVPVKAGENGKLFGSVTSKEIAAALAEAGLPVDKKAIVLHDPIKSAGTHQVNIKLHPKVSVQVSLEVFGV